MHDRPSRLHAQFAALALALAAAASATFARSASAAPTAAPTISPKPASAPPADAPRRLFYVVGSAGTDPLVPLVLNTAAERLQQALFPSGDVWVVPRAAWDASALEAQCQLDPGKQIVIGGIVLDATSGLNGTSYFVLIQRGWEQIDSDAQLVDCSDTAGNLSPAIVWDAHALRGYRSENAAALVTLAGVGTYLASASSASAGIAIGASLVTQASSIGTFPTINQSSESEVAAGRLVRDLAARLITSCLAAPATETRFKAFCAQNGWVAAPNHASRGTSPH